MTTERIDVEVTDKVSPAVAKKIEAIAAGADRAESHLSRLKAALASVNASSVDRLAAAMAKADNAAASLISAQARLTNAQNAGSVAASKVALANQKIATEAARTEAALARAAAATTAAETAAMRYSAATARLAGASSQAANGSQQAATATAAAGVAANGAGNSFRAYVNSLNAAGTAAGTFAGKQTVMNNGMNQSVNAANQYARAARTTTAANANIIAQIQDIGVSLAGGQNPLLVAIQQGSQLSYIASTLEGGMKQLLKTIGLMALAWAPVIAAIGLAIFALNGFTAKINEGAGMDKYVASLGLTRKELKKLEDQHVTMGDTLKATWQVLSETLLSSMGFSTAQIKTFWNDAMQTILKWTLAAFIGIGALTVALVKTIAAIVVNIGKIFYNAGMAAKNLFLIGIEALVNLTIKGINKIGDAANMLSNAAGLGNVVGKLGEIKLATGGVTAGFMQLSKVDPVGEFNAAAENSLANLKKIGAQARTNAKERLAARAKELIADRTPKADKVKKDREGAKDKTAENRAHALDMVNLKLDDELARMKLLKDERAIQARMDQIEEQMAQKKIKLNDGEKKAILEKVTAIEKYKYVQSELDRIYESAIGPARTYASVTQAVNELLAKQAISAQQASQEMVLAARALAQANDPLFAMKEALTTAEAALGKYGVAAQQAAYYEQIRQQYLAKGVILGQNSTAAIDAEVAALMRKNDALMQGQFIQGQLAGILDPMLQDQQLLDSKAQLYAALDVFRQQDVRNEEIAQRAKYALDAKFGQMRLAAASQFFGTLAGLSSSGNKKLAMIGKAAAIGQATIDGILAAQKALASSPPPWNFMNAAAIGVMTGANIAKIISTPVGNFKDGGQFMVQGKSGVDANNINMNVSRGERVTIETAAQQKAADAQTGGGAANVNVPVKVINVRDTSEIMNYMQSSEGEQVILNILRDNPGVVAAAAGSKA